MGILQDTFRKAVDLSPIHPPEWVKTRFRHAVQEGELAEVQTYVNLFGKKIINAPLYYPASWSPAMRDEGTSLTKAAEFKRESILVYLLQNGADVTPVNKEGKTALLLAAEQDSQKSCLALLDHGASVHVADSNGYTPLMRAAHNGNATLVDACLDKGALVDATTQNGVTALMMAKNYQCIGLLLDVGADTRLKDSDGWDALACHASRGNVDCVARLLNVPGVKETSEALLRAAGNGRIECVSQLLRAGTDINACNAKGTTALMKAAGASLPNVVNYLLKAGADPERMDNDGKTAADYARKAAQGEQFSYYAQAIDLAKEIRAWQDLPNYHRGIREEVTVSKKLILQPKPKDMPPMPKMEFCFI